jgi:acyl carrier protein
VAVGTVGAVESALLEVVADALHLSPDEVEPEGSFADYGADSIISVELVRRINARFEIDLKSTSLFNFATVRDLARFIEIEFTDQAPAPAETDVETRSVDKRVAEAKGRTRRLRERIETRRRGAPINAEAKFLAREASKDSVIPPTELPAEATLEHLLAKLEAGEIDVDEAMMVEVMDDA